MESFNFKRTKEIEKAKSELESKLKIKITISGKKVEIEGSPLKNMKRQ